MRINQAKALPEWRLAWQARRIVLSRSLILRWARLVVALVLLGTGHVPASTYRAQAVALAVSGWMYDLTGYEVRALNAKLMALINPPARDLTPEQGSNLVRAYMARAAEIGSTEKELARRASGLEPTLPGDDLELVERLVELRNEQELVRPAVEQVIQQQVTSVLADAGFGIGGVVWPPVQFAFVEPPKKLVVSRRDRIATTNTHLVQPGIPLSEIAAAEAAINYLPNARGYVTDIGGLGAYPAMVVDQAGLDWVLSAVAHEWAHNYLVFFPLGWNYFASQKLTTMNETVADLVGNEIGAAVMARYYPPEPAPLPVPAAQKRPTSAPANDEPVFDFRTEMRVTRLEVDRLLGEGRVAEAEAYMDTRRLEFVEHGYSLRVLNQAYFAFHGSYGTSAASTDPIGPQLRALRASLPGVVEFMQRVRWYTTADDLTRDLADRVPAQTP